VSVMKDVPAMDLICKYVLHDGEKVGESLDIYEGYLIIKNDTNFVGVPLEAISRVEDENIIISEYSEKEGIAIGKEWKERKSRPVSLEDLALEE